MKKILFGFTGCGIYTITSPSNKIYVGQSWNLHDRFLDYKGGYCKQQAKIGASLNKYGFGNHKFEVILQLPEETSQHTMDHWEQWYMDHFRRNGYELMNIREGGSKGRLSKETIEKLRIKLTGQTRSQELKERISKLTSGENNPRYGILGIDNCLSKPVIQFSKMGEFVKEWASVSDVGRQLKIDAGSISKTCNGIRKSAGGFKWKYKEI